MDIEGFFGSMPLAWLSGIGATEVTDGHTGGRVKMHEELSWNTNRVMVHGDVVFTLADTVGGAVLVNGVNQPVLTIDTRIDYLNAGIGGLRTEADVVRLGGDMGTVDMDMHATDGNHVTAVRGVHKTGRALCPPQS